MLEQSKALIEQEFSHLKSNYFNSAYFGPAPQSSIEACEKTLLRLRDPSFLGYEEWVKGPDQLREVLAQLTQTTASQIAHFSSVGDANMWIARGMGLKKNDKIVVMQTEYPSNVIPYKILAEQIGIEVISLSAENFRNPKDLLNRLPLETKALCFSEVSYSTGEAFPANEIAKALKDSPILSVVDGTQSLGGRAFQCSEADVYLVATYKWLLGAYGHAFGRFSEKALQTIQPINISWQRTNGFQTGFRLDHATDSAPGAHRFDRGQMSNITSIAHLKSSLEIMQKIGLETIDEHNQLLAGYFLQNLNGNQFKPLVEKKYSSQIVCLANSNLNAEAAKEKLKKQNIDCTVRQGHLRFAFHFFNNQKQVDRLLQALEDI